MWGTPLIPELRRQQQVALCEFKSNLVFRSSSMLVKATWKRSLGPMLVKATWKLSLGPMLAKATWKRSLGVRWKKREGRKRKKIKFLIIKSDPPNTLF